MTGEVLNRDELGECHLTWLVVGPGTVAWPVWRTSWRNIGQVEDASCARQTGAVAWRRAVAERQIASSLGRQVRFIGSPRWLKAASRSGAAVRRDRQRDHS